MARRFCCPGLALDEQNGSRELVGCKGCPSVRPVLSERARRWIVGEVESSTYFAVAGREATALARTEVVTRLHQPGWWDRLTGWERIDQAESL